MFYLVSSPTQTFHRIMRLRALSRQLGIDRPTNWQEPDVVSNVQHSLGGRIVLLDWSRGRAIADTPVIGVMGIAERDGLVYAASWSEQSISVLGGSQVVRRVTHPWFNHLLGLDLTHRDTYLVASAGSDLIAEVALDGRIAWSWFGPEHGYATRANGTPAFFDRQADYRPLRPTTSEQATHVTSATMFSDETVLATLFIQGQLIAIKRATGRATVKLDGLTKPHGIHRRDGGFLLTDTLGHRIVLLDEELRLCSEIAVGSQWLQDTIVTSAGTYLTLENVHLDQEPEPGLSNRIVEIDSGGRPLRGVDVGVDWRLFGVREIGAELACTLAGAWGRSDDLDTWRWT